MKTFPKPLSPGEEKIWLERCRKGDQEARNILIERNMRLVAHVAKKYQNTDYETEDLLSVGTIGLIKAVNTFKMDRGPRLATYAAKCIENELLMFMRSKKKTSRETSYYEPIGTDKEGNQINFIDIIESEEPDVVERLDKNGKICYLQKLLPEILSEREREIIILRYGLMDDKPVTQKQIAGRLGISRSYVSRIEKRALEKMRAGLESGNV